MSTSTVAPSLTEAETTQEMQAGLSGRLATLDIALATLAYAGPLAGATGYLAVVIGMGNGVGAPSLFLGMMIALLIFSVGYSRMSRHIPNPGAFYAYITAGLGRSVGLASAFFALATYLGVGWGFYAFAGIVSEQFVARFGFTDLPWWAYTLGYWALTGTLAYFHINVSAKVLGVLLIAEVLIIVVFDVLVFAHGGKEGISLEPFTPGAALSGNLGIALVFGIGFFNGFEATAIYREETKDPHITIPRATYLVVLFIGIFYAITAWAFLSGMGLTDAVELSRQDPSNSFFVVAETFGGHLIVDLMGPLLLTSVFAAHLSIQNVASRYVYSLAVDGVLPAALAKAHPRHQSPHRASITVSAIYVLGLACFILGGMTALDIYAQYGGLAQIGVTVAMCVTSLAAVAFFARNKAFRGNGLATIVAPLVAFLCLATFAYLGVSNLSVLTGAATWVNVAMISGLGGIWVFGYAYARWLKSNRPVIYSKIGRQ